MRISPFNSISIEFNFNFNSSSFTLTFSFLKSAQRWKCPMHTLVTLHHHGFGRYYLQCHGLHNRVFFRVDWLFFVFFCRWGAGRFFSILTTSSAGKQSSYFPDLWSRTYEDVQPITTLWLRLQPTKKPERPRKCYFMLAMAGSLLASSLSHFFFGALSPLSRSGSWFIKCEGVRKEGKGREEKGKEREGKRREAGQWESERTCLIQYFFFSFSFFF